MARRRAAAKDRRKKKLDKWKADANGLVRLHMNYFRQVADYAGKVGDLMASRTVDPGEWIEGYALFLGRAVRTVGDWMQSREQTVGVLPLYPGRALRRKRDLSFEPPAAMPIHRAKLRTKEGTLGLPLRVPEAAFVGLRARAKLTPTTDGFVLAGGGTSLPRTRVNFVPETVTASSPYTEIKISDVSGAVSAGAIYRGFVWLKETGQVIAGIEIKVD